MARSRSFRRMLAMILVGLGAACCTGAAWAQAADTEAGAQGRRAAASAVSGACRADLARFCTEPGGPLRQGRAAAICLKPFKTSLSLPCRKAVRGVFG